MEGVPGRWRVDPTLLGQPFAGRAALLSPFDRLVHDRARAMTTAVEHEIKELARWLDLEVLMPEG